MTSPFILDRNRKRLQGQEDPTKVDPTKVGLSPKGLDWQQKDNERVAQETAIREGLAARQRPLASTLGDETFKNRLRINNAMGQDATAGVQGSIQTQRAAQAAAYQQQMADLSAQSMAGVNADGTAMAGSLAANGAGGPQGQYSGDYARLADIARQGGFAEKDIPTAIAVMMAESGGRANAINRNGNGSTDTGIFQINSIHSSWTRGMNLNDPVQNAKAAKRIFDERGGTWAPWVAYQNGAYKKFLQQPSSYTPAPNAIQPYAVPTAGGSGLRAVAVNTAMKALGVPYVWGGNSLTNGVDCSGLVQQVYKNVGMKLPRTAHEQSRGTVGTRVPISQLKPGDLVAWQGGWRGDAYVGHIAIYAGNGQIIEAPQRGVPVRRRALSAADQKRVFGVALRFPGE